MKQWIDKGLLVSLAEELMPGGTMNVNHVDCPAGEDTRSRLYVTRREDGTLLGYCHNCGSRGFVKYDRVTNIHWAAVAEDPPQFNVDEVLSTSSVHPITRYIDFEHITPIKEFMLKYGIANSMAEQDMWRYGAWKDMFILMFPYYRKDGDTKTFTGCQVRHMLSNEELAKRKLPKIKTYGTIAPHIFNPHDSPTVVICEDRVSGVKLAQAGYAACVMNGSAPISGPDAHALAMMFDHIVVWYDNDNLVVRTHAEQTEQACKMFNDWVYRVSELGDPKRYREDDIRSVIL